MLGASTEDLQKLVLTIGGGGVVGYFIANKYNKSKTLGVILGIGVTLGSLYVFRIYEKNEFRKQIKSMEENKSKFKLSEA
jgi:NAD kinase